MKKSKIKIEYLEYESIDELAKADQTLLRSARETAKNAYAPYSGFRVGAAVLLENGEIVKGCNQENAAYPSGLCAERIALFHAAATYPGIAVKALAVSNDDNGNSQKQKAKPCGACLQVLSEFEDLAGSPVKIILDGNNCINIIEGIDKLLPFRFKKNDLFQRKL